MNLFSFQPQTDPTVTVSFISRALTFPYFLDQICVWIRLPQSLDKGIVAAPGYLKEFTHD